MGLSYLRAFRKLGKEPVCFDMAQEYAKSAAWLTRNRYLNKVIFPYASGLMNKKLLKAAREARPELIFIHKGHWIFPETLKQIKKETAALLFIFNPDDPFNLNPGASSDFIRDSVSIYDAYFIWSKFLSGELKKAGAKITEYLAFGYDAELHYPVNCTADDRRVFGSDVVFVGNWDQERQRWLSVLAGYNLSIWGTDYWKFRCRNKFLRSAWKGQVVIGEQMSRVCLTSKINLNVLRLQNKGSHNMRTFEIPASGGFMLQERSNEVLEFFEEGKEIECFSSVKELKDKINFYLNNDDLRIKVSQAGYQRCLQSGYLYLDRIKQVLKVYDKLRGR